MSADMGDKITITTEKDGRITVFEGSGTLTLIERPGGWVDTHPLSMPPREVRGVEIEWDGSYTIREASHQCGTLEDLREENRRLDAEADGAISLDGLRAAWEAAEQADECREGDVLIERYPNRSWHVYRAESMFSVCRDIRILSRAPRQPWQDLADVMLEDDMVFEEDAEGIAKRLYERGVRVTGGDEA